MDRVEFEYKVNSKAYNERFAKYMLSTVFDLNLEKAHNLDRPDILFISKDYSYGVEVTTVMDTFYNALKRYKQVWAKKDMSLEEISKNVPNVLRGKLGISPEGNIVLRSPYNKRIAEGNLSELKSVVEGKLKKLQRYDKYENNDLFVFATGLGNTVPTDKIKSVIDSIDKSKYKTIFDNVIIFNYDSIQIYPQKTKDKVQVLKLDLKDIERCDRLATVDVIEYLREQEEIKRIEKEYNKERNKPNKKNSKKSKNSKEVEKPVELGE